MGSTTIDPASCCHPEILKMLLTNLRLFKKTVWPKQNDHWSLICSLSSRASFRTLHIYAHDQKQQHSSRPSSFPVRKCQAEASNPAPTPASGFLYKPHGQLNVLCSCASFKIYLHPARRSRICTGNSV